MTTPARLRLTLALLAGATLAGAAAERGETFGGGRAVDPMRLPPSVLTRDLDGLPAPARAQALRKLEAFPFHRHDCDHLHLDREGSPFFVCAPPAEAAAATVTAPTTAAAGVPVAGSVPVRHSRAGASRVIFLDFNGATISGTQWNSSLGRTTIEAVAYDTDGDPSTFSDAELTAIDRIWRRVAEDYAPFDVDVTTEAPATITATTAVVQITRSTDAGGNANPSSSAGGVAYIGVFGNSSYASYRPAWVYANNLGGGRDDHVAEAASHEAGHNFGLTHDGTSTTSYYPGHGSGETAWGPIMGTGYFCNLSQWSKGEYADANNTQDDLAVLAGKLAYRGDDHGDSPAAASAAAVSGTVVSASGLIATGADVDVVRFTCGAGSLSIAVDPLVIGANTRGGNLDVQADLLDAAGTVLATSNPADRTGAALTATIPAGTYYVRVGGVGMGSPTGTGYSDYGSLGQWFLSGTLPAAVAAPGSIAWTATTATVGESAGTVTLTARRGGGSAGAVGASWATANGSASAGSDYVAAGGTLAWADGDTADKTVTVTISGDALVEGGETFVATLSGASGGATLGSASTTTVTIGDDDAYGTIALTSASVAVGEGAGNVVLTVRRSGGSAGAVGVSWATADGSASAGSDYVAGSGTLAWAAGDSADKTVTLGISDDALAESAETLTLTLSAATGGATLGGTASATVTIADNDVAPLPAPWQTADVGAVAAAGSAGVSDGSWTVRGSGADIGGTSDEFRFVWQELTGDGEIVARVASLTNTNNWAKAGVMIRDGGAANAKHAMMVQSAGNRRAFFARSATGGSTAQTSGGNGSAPVWVKLARSGSTFTGYRSSDGVAWTRVGSSTIAMGATVRVGLVVTSRNDGALCTASLSGVAVTPTGVN